MPSRKAELPMNGAAKLIGASTLPCEPTLLLLAAPVRRLLSTAVGSSRRQPPNTYLLHTTRDFVFAVSLSVASRPLVSVCVLRRAHTRGGGGIRLSFARSRDTRNLSQGWCLQPQIYLVKYYLALPVTILLAINLNLSNVNTATLITLKKIF